jgi:hypothetical protein
LVATWFGVTFIFGTYSEATTGVASIRRIVEAFFDFAGATRAGENLSGQLNEVHRPMVAGLSGAKLDQ